MDDFHGPDDSPGHELAILETELTLLIRKLLAKDFFAQQRVETIFRQLRYEESLGLPAPADRH